MLLNRVPISRRIACGTLMVSFVFLQGCTYFGQVRKQRELEESFSSDPNAETAKHLATRSKFIVYGVLAGGGEASGKPLAVAAISSDYSEDEIVDVCHFCRSDSYYGLILPAGSYEIVALRDVDGDGLFEDGELVASDSISVNEELCPDRVLRLEDLQEGRPRAGRLRTLPIAVAMPDAERAESLFYPRGTLRSLSDPIFSPQTTQLGLYDPAAFMRVAPLMFYALEEDIGYKIPVVFVHGIDGSPRNFEAILGAMDHSRYKAWFFFYPSGADLRQMAQLFHDIFLSGSVIPKTGTPVVVVAHSMGGLVVREALNLWEGPEKGGQDVRSVITIASPFGGMDSAGFGVRHAPLVLPAWRCLDPGSDFVAGLFRSPMKDRYRHYGLLASLSLVDGLDPADDDGVVPVSSQFPEAAHREFAATAACQAGHVDILQNPQAIEFVVSHISEVSIGWPDEHLDKLGEGGFDVELGDDYSPVDRYTIQTYGHYFRALLQGEIDPLEPSQAHLLDVIRGLAEPQNPSELLWLRFTREHPDLMGLTTLKAAQ